MTFKNKTIQKSISCLIILAMFTPTLLLSLKPKQVEAVNPVGVPVNDFTIQAQGWKNIAKEVLRQALIITAKKLLAKMTQNTVNWINSGFHGNPLYLENPKSFFKDIAKFEIRTLVNLFGYDSRRFPFGRDFALSTIYAYQRQLADNAEYTLSRVIDDPELLDQYRNDFYVGGWNGFLINTQYPQNNYLGFQMLATEELARRLDGTATNNANKVIKTLDRGMGFLSPQTCPSNPNYPLVTNPYDSPAFKETPFSPPIPGPGDVLCTFTSCEPTQQFKDRYNQYKANWERTNRVNRENFDKKYSCPEGLVDTTPGSVIASQITGALGSTRTQKELAAALGNSIATILDTLMNHFMSKGLNALSNKINPGDGVTKDNFTYFGDTVDSALQKAGEYESYTPPEIPIETPPEETGTPPTSLISDIQAERGKYPASFTSICTNPSGLEPASCPLGQILNTVAWNNKGGWGLNRKTGGHRCQSPAGEIACDILQYGPTGIMYDVFGSSETLATPMWGIAGQPNPPGPDRPWVAPAQP